MTDGARTCGWCLGPIGATQRRDAVYCTTRCRQAAHRFGRHRGAVDVAMALTELLAALEGERRTHAAASRAGSTRQEATMREPTMREPDALNVVTWPELP